MIEKDTLVKISLMSQILEFGSYEKLFDDLVDETVIDLSRQTLVVHIKEMDSGEIVAGIKKKLKLMKNWSVKSLWDLILHLPMCH